MLAQVKLIAAIVLALGLIGAGGYAVYKYESMSKTILQDKQRQAILQKANADQKAVIDQRQKDLSDQQAAYASLQQRLDTNATEYQNLLRRFKTTNTAVGTKDLSTLAAAKPGLVQDIVNKGTTDVIHCFEQVTGATSNEKVPNCDAVAVPSIGVQPVSASSTGK